MAYVDPDSIHIPSPGEDIPSVWGETVNDNLEWLATDHPHCSVYHNTTQTLTHNTITELTANSELSDIGGMHSTVTDNTRITIPTGGDGLYMATATVSWAANATGERLARFIVDGTTAVHGTAGGANPAGGLSTIANITRFISLDAGQYVEVQSRQTSGGDLAATLHDFSIQWVATA